MERRSGLGTSVFLAIRENVRPPSFWSILIQLLHFNYTLTFFGACFNRTLTFCARVSLLKAKFLLFSKTSTVPLLPHGASRCSPLVFFTKLFFGSFSLFLHLDSLHFTLLPTFPSWNALTKWQLRHHRLSLVFPCRTSPIKGIFTYPTSLNSFLFVISSAGTSSSKLLSNLRFD